MSSVGESHLSTKRLPPTPAIDSSRVHTDTMSASSSLHHPPGDSKSKPQALQNAEDENTMLKIKLAYVHKLQEQGDILVYEVRSVVERLQTAVLEFRNIQRKLDSDFIQGTPF